MRRAIEPHRALMPLGPRFRRRMEALAMMDLFSLLLGVGLLALMAVYATLCDHI